MKKTPATNEEIHDLVERFGKLADQVYEIKKESVRIGAELADIIVRNMKVVKEEAPEKKPGAIRLGITAEMDSAVQEFFDGIDNMFDGKPKKSPTKSDSVSHPKHYQGKMECIDAMEKEFGSVGVEWFCLLNAFKYEYRKGKKGSSDEDTRKRDWYIAKFNRLCRARNRNTIAAKDIEKLVNKYK